MKNFTYIDKAGIMHTVTDFQTAVDFAKKGTQVVKTEIEANHGFPVVAGEEIIVYSPEEMKIDATGDTVPVIPKLATLYKECLA